MSDLERDAADNLEFFKSAILDPAIESRSSTEYTGHNIERSIVSDFGAIEAAHWAWLGAQIGYFDGKDVQELISSSEGVFEAWSNLRNLQVISPGERWADVIRAMEGGPPVLNKEAFSVATEINYETRELLQNTFQIFLLLTAENILEDDSRYFLDTIGWADDEKWSARRRGAELRGRSGTVRKIQSGFANVLGYLEAMDSSSNSAVKRDDDDPYTYIARRVDRATFSGQPFHGTVVWNFTQDARAILSRRFNLGKAQTTDRYFALAGECATRAWDDSPEWLDARRAAFTRLLWLVNYAGGGLWTRTDEPRLWNLFTGSAPTPRTEIKVGRSDKGKVEPTEGSI
jgi:hypothetical protein